MIARQALGKGLGALIPEKSLAGVEGKKVFNVCGIEEIQPNPFQPRKVFNDEQLQGLISSIKEKGILQPLIVRRKGNGYELIAGERRWRAAQKAGMKEVPVVIKDVPEEEILELSLIENIQRENLNPIEEAEAFKRLMDQFHLTQEEISRKVAKDRTTITNAIRLLKLPQDIKQSLANGTISMGHARAFLSLDGPEKQRLALKKVLADGLSVRQTENLVKRLRVNPPRSLPHKNQEWNPLVEELQRALGTKVKITGKGKRGRIEIEFYSRDELDRLIDLLRR
ncbi:MAG: ParB/RepB/Spo0J family partition protein [Thermodesulfobacteriota bacterium]|nr:ParB/RepB/Spo0J family partition protein [Thermodesulfobacteriota bacterium]